MKEINKVPYNIISSGSEGNAIIYFNELLVDLGVSYQRVKEYENDIKYVFISHIHGDHFNKTAIRMLSKAKPLIKFIVGEHLYDEITDLIEDYKVIKIELGKSYKLGNNIVISPLYLYHNVTNFGLRMFANDLKVIHATDTYTLEGITAKNYDFYMIEVNHCEDKMALLDEQRDENSFSHSYASRENHMSKQNAYKWFNEQNENSKGVLIPLHQSSTYL